LSSSHYKWARLDSHTIPNSNHNQVGLKESGPGWSRTNDQAYSGSIPVGLLMTTPLV
jgi:hypothetical protein